MSEYANVPVVVYVDGERHIIGVASVSSEEIEMTVGKEAGKRIMNYLLEDDMAEVSIKRSFSNFHLRRAKRGNPRERFDVLDAGDH